MVQMKHSNLSHLFTQRYLWQPESQKVMDPESSSEKQGEGPQKDLELILPNLPVCFFFSLQTQLSTFRALVSLLLLPDLRRGAPVTDDNQQQDLPRVHPPQSSPPQRAEVDFQRSPVSSLAHGTCVIPDRSLSWGF